MAGSERTDTPLERVYLWQVKVLGFYWRFSLASWENWHRPESEPSVRRAWWWRWSFHRNSRSCFRICGLTLESKSTPYMDYSEYGV